ncbi:PREDICTED: peroxisomal membrane protein 2 isoform X2 [Polistes dominula]|uniref:Peroxisomal membrane protein 2 isoform X2 n=1 Tax=Polistes dominula TaxID=743375 RepID=A0ABM1I3H2_POLDO|nr:PREDICTED: peroxisomal membrane protein 2 isoform X2 [Polistes dominula]
MWTDLNVRLKYFLEMAFSKPTEIIFNLTSVYFRYLYTNPIKTKAIASCIINALGNLIQQKLSGNKFVDEDKLIAFGLFGLLLGGTVPHFFYSYTSFLVKNPLTLLLMERLIYTPCFQALTLYALARLEGKSHKDSKQQLNKLYWPVLLANLKYVTLLQYINVKYVPIMLRTLILDLISFIWSIYLTNKCEKVAAAGDKKSKK